MSDLEIYIFLAVLVVPAIGIMWIWRKLRAPFEKRKDEEYTAKFQSRLRSPDFAAVEAHFEVTLPSFLKDFYRSDLVANGCDLTIDDEEWSIAFFEPIDADSLRESWPGCERFVSIANDGCGNEYVFDPNTDARTIRFHDHETGEFSDVTSTLEEFLKVVRESIEKTGSEQEDPSRWRSSGT